MAVSMAQVSGIFLLLQVLYLASAQDLVSDFLFGGSGSGGSGSGYGKGDPTLIDHELDGDDNGGDDYADYYYEFPYNPATVDICQGYPIGMNMHAHACTCTYVR